MINSTIANDRPRREAIATEAFLGAPNEESFIELFLTLTPQLVSFFRSRGCTRDLSEDLSQEVMLTVYRKGRSFAIERGSVPGYFQLHGTRYTAVTGSAPLKWSPLMCRTSLTRGRNQWGPRPSNFING